MKVDVHSSLIGGKDSLCRESATCGDQARPGSAPESLTFISTFSLALKIGWLHEKKKHLVMFEIKAPNYTLLIIL